MERSSSGPTYDPTHFEKLFAIEQDHAWFKARNELIGEVACEVTNDLPDGYRVLEVGCGTGAVLQVLEKRCPRGHVIGLDNFPEGLQFARHRTSCPLVIGDANAPPFGEAFDLVGLFDVLEHLPDDEGVLRKMRSLLLPGGVLLLTVPANPDLWSYFDVASNHVRRYGLDELRSKLIAAGFEIEYITHFMRALVPVMWSYRRLVPRLGNARGIERDLKIILGVNDLLYWLLSRDHHSIGQRKFLQSGTSILAVARRQQNRERVLF